MAENRQGQRRSSGGGEIVEVEGGHIVRSTGRKDRHSKVCTAKGPRDRRVRLAAHTAIQFYDVQDRLGYDRPSKAVDWLIKKAKPAIDELAELPAWKPNTTISTSTADNLAGTSSDKRIMTMTENENESSFLPPSLDSDTIADTIKSFFPMGASEAANSSSSMQFQSFAQQPDLPSRINSHTQDLRLSLQSFQDPSVLLHHQNQQPSHHSNQNHRVHHVQAQPHFAGFDSSAWSAHHHQQRFPAWHSSGDAASVVPGGGGYLLNPPQPLFQQLFGSQNNQLFSSQRGPLQSSYTPSVRAWMDPSSAIAIAAGVDPNQQYHQSAMLPIYPSSLSSIGVGEFSGFRIPARIQGEEEEHDGISDKPSSASSDSRR